jgi:TonB family protein
MGIFLSQRPGRAAESDPVPASPDEVSSSDRRSGTRKTLIGGRLVTVRLGADASGLALDLSDSGMGLRAFPNLEVGSTTSLLFELPDLNTRVEAVGKVEWVERVGSLWSKGSGGRAGLSFVDLSDTTRSLLNQWVLDDLPRLQPVKPALAPPPGGWFGSPGTGSPVADMRRQLQQDRVSGQAALQWIAERVLRLSGADGAAIALDDGQGMVCRATLGNAPDFGVRIHSASGLSGECVRTGQIVRCDDTENDPRVDPALCRELNLRCALILPLYRGPQLCGVLEVFSARPYAFASDTVSFLQQVSELLVEVVVGVLPELGGEADVSLARLISPTSKAIEEGVQAPAMATGQFSDAPEREPRPPVKTAALSDSIPCDVCGHSNPRGQRTCSSCDVPLSVVENFLDAPTSEQVRAAEAAALLARSRYGVGERLSPAGSGETRRDLKPLLAIGVLLVVASLGLGIWKGAHSNVVSPQPETAGAVQSQAVPAQSQPDVSATATPVPVIPPIVLEAEQPDEPPPPKATAASPANAAPPVSSRPAQQEAASVRWILGGKSSAKAAAQIEPAPLPAPTTGQIPHLPYIVVVPEPPRTDPPPSVSRTLEPSSAGITGGELIRKVAPVYPPIARSIGKQGSVVLAATVDREGMLKNLHAVDGDPMLVSAALDAARKWRYEPYRLNGNPIEIETQIVFHFRR